MYWDYPTCFACHECRFEYRRNDLFAAVSEQYYSLHEYAEQAVEPTTLRGLPQRTVTLGRRGLCLRAKLSRSVPHAKRPCHPLYFFWDGGNLRELNIFHFSYQNLRPHLLGSMLSMGTSIISAPELSIQIQFFSPESSGGMPLPGYPL
jgi:hypothetical protein